MGNAPAGEMQYLLKVNVYYIYMYVVIVNVITTVVSIHVAPIHSTTDYKQLCKY